MRELEKLFFCGVSTLKEFEFLSDKNVGGVLLYPKVFEDPSQFMEVIYRLQKKQILLSTDHEGGQLEIIPFVPPSPGNLLFGRTQPSYVESYCHMAGKIMKSLGMNMVFAPVLDLLFSKTSPVIGYRSYGENHKTVAQMGSAAIKGYKSAGIYCCAKHFPGHGRSHQDTHEDLSIVNDPLNELEKEIYPFEVAIQNGVDSIMLSHVVYKALDDKPASISKKIIKQLLREQLKYDGLVLSDAVEMNALSGRYKPLQIVVDFFNASGDMLILSDPRNLKTYLETLKDALDRGKLDKSSVDQSIEKINFMSKEVQSDICQVFEAIEKAVDFYVEKSKTQSITLVLPDSALYTKADVSSSYISVIEKQARKTLNAKTVHFSQAHSLPESETIIDLIIDATEEEISLHRKLSERFNVIYVITRNPYLANYLRDKNHVVTYSLTPLVMGWVFRRLSQILKGGEFAC